MTSYEEMKDKIKWKMQSVFFCDYFRVTRLEELKLPSLFNYSLSHLLVPILLNFIPLDQLGLIWTWDIILHWGNEKRGRFRSKQELRHNFFGVSALLQLWSLVSQKSIFVFLLHFRLFRIKCRRIRLLLIIDICFLSYFIRSNLTFLWSKFWFLLKRLIVSFLVMWCKLFFASWVFLAVWRLRLRIRVANVFWFIFVRYVGIVCFIFRC